MRSATRAKKANAEIDRERFAFIKAQPCVVCEPGSQTTVTEAAHIGPRGRATEGNSGAGKGSNKRILPLCVQHHRESHDSLHQLGPNFWKLKELDFEKLIADFNARFDAGERERA